MASHTLTLNSAPAIGYPEGTSVAIYPVSNWPTPDKQRDPSAATPVGSSTATASVSSGNIAFGSVADGDYWAYASVGGNRIYRLVHVGGPDPSGDVAHLSPDQTFAGVQTFSQAPVLPALSIPTAALAANAVTAAKASTGTGSTNLAVGNDARFTIYGAYNNVLASSALPILGSVAAGTFIWVSGTAFIAVAAASSGQGSFRFDPADYPTISGLTLKLRLRALCQMNSVALTAGTTFTYAMSPITGTGGGSNAQPTIATVGAASGSVVITDPAVSVITTADSADFTAPAAGSFCLTVTNNQATAANAVTTHRLILQYHYA